MKSALIGYTGLVGSNLAAQTKFTDLYNSSNISDIRGKQYDLIVSAGTKAERWKANQDPEADWKGIKNLLDNLKFVKAKKFVLISTVDVYPNPDGVDERTSISQKDHIQAYGLNRYKMENFVRRQFPSHLIVRCTQLYGLGLKKNFIYDLIYDNALNFTHQDTLLQFYHLDHLWQDIQTALKNDLKLINLAVEPISARDIAKYTLGIDFQNITEKPPARYNLKTVHSILFNSKHGYIYHKNTILKETKKFINDSKSTKLALSNLAWEQDNNQDIIKLLHKYNIKAIEVAPTKVWNDPVSVKDIKIEQYKKFWSDNGIRIISTTSLLYGHPELTIFENLSQRRNTLKYLSKIIKLSSILGAKNMVLGSPKNRIIGKLNPDKARDIAIDFFYKVGDFCKEYGIFFGIEPNPPIYGTDFINNTAQAVELVKDVKHPNFQINLDSGAIHENSEKYLQTIQSATPYACHFHISEPGLGIIPNNHVNHSMMANALKKSSYNKWMAIEMPLKPDKDNLQVIEKTLKFVTSTYR